MLKSVEAQLARSRHGLAGSLIAKHIRFA